MKRIISLILAVVLIAMLVPTDASAAKKKKGPSPSDYYAVFNAQYYAEKYPDLKAAFGTDEKSLFNHFYSYGMSEGRQGSEEFNVQAYMTRYPDLKAAFGNDLKSYYVHYIVSGKAEGRNAKAVAQAAKPAAQPAKVDERQQNFNEKRNALINEYGYGFQPGQMLPEITMYDLNDQPHKTTDFLGSPLYINLYTTWCGPCNYEAPDLEAMWKVHSNKSMLIMVDVDYAGQDNKYFINEHKLTMPVYQVNGYFGSMRVSSIPRQIVVDRYGQVVAYKTGMTSSTWIDEQLRKAEAIY